MVRGDKNKRGSSGRGSSNEGNQPFKSSKRSKSSDLRHETGWASQIQERSTGIAGDRNEHQLRADERRFNLIVDNVPYMVKAVPFTFNGETRYRISFNESSEHVFTWDSSLRQLRAIDDDASMMPDNLEIAISEKLQSKG